MNVARLCLVSAAMLLPTFALAAHRHSIEDELACTPDVYRLCSAQVPDEDAIVKCLKQNRTALSQGCHKVFSQPANASDDAATEDD
jgi:hypothetical protein